VSWFLSNTNRWIYLTMRKHNLTICTWPWIESVEKPKKNSNAASNTNNAQNKSTFIQFTRFIDKTIFTFNLGFLSKTKCDCTFKEKSIRDKNKRLIWSNLPVGRNRKIQRIANQRQSLGRFGICGSNFFRRWTTVAVLDAFEIADERVRMVNVLE
jgi:hypothetical protein